MAISVSTDRVTGNPLYEMWQAAMRGSRRPSEKTVEMGKWSILLPQRMVELYEARVAAVSRFAFAIPSPEAVEAIRRHAPRLVELGAGTGYWAMVLAEAGVDVVALDTVPSGRKNRYFDGQQIGAWYPVTRGSARHLTDYQDRALLLCWPVYDDPMAMNAVLMSRAEIVLYVGEPRGGCTANEAFFDYLAEQYRMVEAVALPQWPGIHDRLEIWRRR